MNSITSDFFAEFLPSLYLFVFQNVYNDYNSEGQSVATFHTLSLITATGVIILM